MRESKREPADDPSVETEAHHPANTRHVDLLDAVATKLRARCADVGPANGPARSGRRNADQPQQTTSSERLLDADRPLQAERIQGRSGVPPEPARDESVPSGCERAASRVPSGWDGHRQTMSGPIDEDRASPHGVASLGRLGLLANSTADVLS